MHFCFQYSLCIIQIYRLAFYHGVRKSRAFQECDRLWRRSARVVQRVSCFLLSHNDSLRRENITNLCDASKAQINGSSLSCGRHIIQHAAYSMPCLVVAVPSSKYPSCMIHRPSCLRQCLPWPRSRSNHIWGLRQASLCFSVQPVLHL